MHVSESEFGSHDEEVHPSEPTVYSGEFLPVDAFTRALETTSDVPAMSRERFDRQVEFLMEIAVALQAYGEPASPRVWMWSRHFL